ncbi:MAG: hypothetical protein J6K94_07705 [Ruminiclostridium sp.]|nr:hypothetical protein [Ruminiclostridium sp.]
MEQPRRKRLRLQGYDYSQHGAYFVTICTQDKKSLFGSVGADMESAPTISAIVQTFKRISTIEYIRLVKAGKVPRFEKRIWQRFFYDHIIRDESDYLRISTYIQENPAKWRSDRYYVPK